MRPVRPYALLLLLGCATWTPVDRSTLPRAEAYPDAGAVILLDSMQVTYGVDGEVAVAEVTVRRQVQLLRDAGRDALALVAYYRPAFDTVIAARARTLTP